MLTEEEIRQALHADRVVPLPAHSPHGPFGLEHLASLVAQVSGSPVGTSAGPRVRRALELRAETWEKLDHLAKSSAPGGARTVTASEVAAAIVEQFVATHNS